MKKICEICNGTGQVSYFKGESRFLLSEEDCPECCGMGFRLIEDESLQAVGKEKLKDSPSSPKESP